MNLLSQNTLEIRVTQQFRPEPTGDTQILRSPAYTLEGPLLKSMLLLRKAEPGGSSQ